MTKLCLLFFGLIFLKLSQSQTTINIGGIFDPSYPSEYEAFLLAIDDINSGNINNADLFSNITLNASYIISSSSSQIKQIADMLATDVSIVIGPRYSSEAERFSPLFELTKTPCISYRASASDLSDTDTFPYFFRTVPDVLDLATPIIALFQTYGWEQAVLIHSSGHWGRGLNYLVQIGAESGIVFQIVEIPDGYTVDMISSQLKLLTEYEIFILHVPTDQRGNIYAAADANGLIREGIAWLGTNDIAVSISSDSTEMAVMEGSLAIRPITPDTDASIDLLQRITSTSDWHAYFVYDAVVMAAYALAYTQDELGVDIVSKSALNDYDYFGSIQYYLSNGNILRDSLHELQLGSNWTMTGSIYLRGNTRRMPYELVNLQNGEWEIVAQFNWNSDAINAILSNDSYCNALANTAQSAAQDEYTELITSFTISDCSLFANFTSSKRCNTDIITFYTECLRDLMGLYTYTSLTQIISEALTNSHWIYSDAISWINSSTSIPIGAQFSKSNPLRVLLYIIEPWGSYSASNLDSTDAILGYTGLLPTLWNYLIAAHGLTCAYEDGSMYSQEEVLDLISSGSYDVALGAFTITSTRSSRVRFLHQFYGGGQRILTFDPTIVNENAWFFLAPLSNWLWIAWICAIIGVAHLLWIMEWDTPTFKQEDEDTGRLRRMPYHWAILNALTTATSVLYFTHEAPRGKHSRWFIAVWEYIVLILISAYTANMVSFITNSSAVESVIADEASLYLEDSYVITVSDTASADILSSANITYTECDSAYICLQMMYNSINTSLNASAFVEYYNAFVYDDLSIEYWAQTSSECTLITGGTAFNTFSAAIATRYSYIPEDILTAIDLLIIKLWSNGTITEWIEEFISSDYECAAFEGAADETTPLTVVSFYPLWILIGSGSLIFCTVVICTVERSKTPIDQQLLALNELVQKGDEQITRVGTLSSVGIGIQQMNTTTDRKQKQNVDLYQANDGDEDKDEVIEEEERKQIEMQQMALSEEEEEEEEEDQEEEEEQGIVEEEQGIVEEEGTDGDNENKEIEMQEMASKQELQKYETPKGKAGLEALSTMAIGIDPFEEAFDQQDSRKEIDGEEKEEQKEDKEDEEGSLKIETEYNEEDEEEDQKEKEKQEIEQEKENDDAHETQENEDKEESVAAEDDENDEKGKGKEDDDVHETEENDENDEKGTEKQDENEDDDDKESIEDKESAKEAPTESINTLSEDDINDAFDDNEFNNLQVMADMNKPRESTAL